MPLKLKSKWYRRPSLAGLGKGWKSTASCLTKRTWETMKNEPARYGIHFPYKTVRYFPMQGLDIEPEA